MPRRTILTLAVLALTLTTAASTRTPSTSTLSFGGCKPWAACDPPLCSPDDTKCQCAYDSAFCAR